jgi:hypothetical protein
MKSLEKKLVVLVSILAISGGRLYPLYSIGIFIAAARPNSAGNVNPHKLCLLIKYFCFHFSLLNNHQLHDFLVSNSQGKRNSRFVCLLNKCYTNSRLIVTYKIVHQRMTCLCTSFDLVWKQQHHRLEGHNRVAIHWIHIWGYEVKEIR